MVLKFGAYLLTGSVSLLSDAAESSVNLIAASVAFVALTIAARPADENYRYGYDKAEYFSSGVEGALILVAAVTIIYTAVKRFLNPVPLTDLGLGLAISLVASGINFGVSRFMFRKAEEFDSITLEADAHHLMTDVWTSVGVVAALVVVMFAPPSGRSSIRSSPWSLGLNIIRTGISLVKRSAAGLMDITLPVGGDGSDRGSAPGEGRAGRRLPQAAHAQVRLEALYRVSPADARGTSPSEPRTIAARRSRRRFAAGCPRRG